MLEAAGPGLARRSREGRLRRAAVTPSPEVSFRKRSSQFLWSTDGRSGSRDAPAVPGGPAGGGEGHGSLRGSRRRAAGPMAVEMPSEEEGSPSEAPGLLGSSRRSVRWLRVVGVRCGSQPRCRARGTRARCVAGHFMGKKSVPGTQRMDELRQPAAPMSFGPSLRALLEDVVELLTRELLKILLQERLLDQNQRKYDLADQVNIGWYGGRCPEQGGGGDGSTCAAAGGSALSRIVFG